MTTFDSTIAALNDLLREVNERRAVKLLQAEVVAA